MLVSFGHVDLSEFMRFAASCLSEMGFLGVAGSDMMKILPFWSAGGGLPRSRSQYSPWKAGVKEIHRDFENFYIGVVNHGQGSVRLWAQWSGRRDVRKPGLSGALGPRASTKVDDASVTVTRSDDRRQARVLFNDGSSQPLIDVAKEAGRITELQICTCLSHGVAAVAEVTDNEKNERSYHWATAWVNPWQKVVRPWPFTSRE
jgi:hypothetical protein